MTDEEREIRRQDLALRFDEWADQGSQLLAEAKKLDLICGQFLGRTEIVIDLYDENYVYYLHESKKAESPWFPEHTSSEDTSSSED